MPPLHRDAVIINRTGSTTTTERLDYRLNEQTNDGGDSQAQTPPSSGTDKKVKDSDDQSGDDKTNQSVAMQAQTVETTTSTRDDVETKSDKTPTESSPLLQPHDGDDDVMETRAGSISDAPLCKPSVPDVPFTGWSMFRWWVFRLIIPPAVLAYYLTNSAWVATFAALLLPSISMYQGATGILHYRATYGDSPMPQAPSHGVVKVRSKDSKPSPVASKSRPKSPRDMPNDNSPLRLLLIGDSLAIGVGQSYTPTPVMPEIIAKTLSRSMGGRPVLWTCHGASGASAAWIVKEFERSIQQGRFMHAKSSHGGMEEEGSHSSITFDINELTDAEGRKWETKTGFVRGSAKEAENDSSSDDSSSNDAEVDEETHSWQERLRQERIHYDPNTVGPFDIVVVLTGSNDLKSAFFPFLLFGEEAEFRKQAQERGGGYTAELKRVIQTLDQRMRQRLETLRESVEEATQKMRERLGSLDGGSPQKATLQARLETSNVHSSKPVTQATVAEKENDKARSPDESKDKSNDKAVTPHFPMVVLPGNPARALPVFTRLPLHWLAIPMVDIMDNHKRGIAKQHPGEVLFVPAPTVKEISEYVDEEGDYRRQQKEEDVVLQLRDLKRRHARRIVSDMNEYFHLSHHGPVNRTEPTGSWNRHFSIFSVDGTHPNDNGYEFWGRHIGSHIVKEWKRRQES